MNKLKNWIKHGNDCEKCKMIWEEQTSHEYNEWECGCKIYGYCKDKPCHLIEPFKTIIGFLKERRNNYYTKHQYDNYIKFTTKLEAKDDKMCELILSTLMDEQPEHIICWKDRKGDLHECNTEGFIRHHAWEIRTAYDDFAHPITHEKLSTEWKKLINKTLKQFYKTTIGKIIPYIIG